MKKVILILVLFSGLTLLSSCGSTYESFQSHNPGYAYYAKACPASNPNVDDCGVGASSSKYKATEAALTSCGWTYNDCVVVRVNNQNVYQESLNEKQSVSLASMMVDAKNTCKELGFTEGTDKFSDCSLKLYSQSLELAAKQNQKIQNVSSGVMTIYDPRRDSRILINQGQRMLSGACTLGINC